MTEPTDSKSNEQKTEKMCLVISGGGVKGYGMLGVAQYLDEFYDLAQFDTYVGTSIGAIIGYLFCIGYKPLEIVHSTIRNEVLKQLSHFSGDLPSALFSEYGLLHFEPISEFLELMTLSKHGRLFTFQSLYDTLGQDFACLTYNYTKLRTQLLHRTTTPDLPCLQALQMSASIPFVFTQCIHKNQVFFDGGLVDNFPIRVALKLDRTRIIGIVSSVQSPQELQDTEYAGISLMLVLSLAIMENTRRTIRKYRKRCEIIDIPLDNNVLDFQSDLPTVMEMFSAGYRAAKQHYS
jgi:NTE family protein